MFFNPETGKPYRDVMAAFKGASRRAGIKGLRFHDLRHTFATRLISKGVDIITVQNLLGHSTVLVTQRYTHSHDDRKIKAVELLNSKPKEKLLKKEKLLHSCDMEKEELLKTVPTHSFSVN